MATPPTQLDLFLPDRYDMLVRRAPDQLQSIVVPVESSLEHFDDVYRDLRAAGRGGLWILRGDTGSGKSTFLNTISLFRAGVDTLAIQAGADIGKALKASRSTSQSEFLVVVVEGREALTDTSRQELEKALHAINAFVRTDAGSSVLVVWPCNTDELRDLLTEIAGSLGGESLLGTWPQTRFAGPPQADFYDIANRTVHTLNAGAGISDLGVSEEQARELAKTKSTIGSYLAALRGELTKNKSIVSSLLGKERCRLWTVILASNDPEGDVAALTRGSLSTIDIERLVTATNANVVKELKEYPDKLGILGTVLDSKILYIPTITALAIARQFGSDALRKRMEDEGMSITKEVTGVERLLGSELGRAFRGESLGTRNTGQKPGSNTMDAFAKLARIAATEDGLLNQAFGEALVAASLIDSYEPEADLGSGLRRKTDLLCTKGQVKTRLEFMWRKTTGRAAIANYVLTKLYNYGRAIGFLAGLTDADETDDE